MEQKLRTDGRSTHGTDTLLFPVRLAVDRKRAWSRYANLPRIPHPHLTSPRYKTHHRHPSPPPSSSASAAPSSASSRECLHPFLPASSSARTPPLQIVLGRGRGGDRSRLRRVRRSVCVLGLRCDGEVCFLLLIFRRWCRRRCCVISRFRSGAMGVHLCTPKTEKYVQDGEGGRVRYGLASMQGWRTTMEDAVSFPLSPTPIPSPPLLPLSVRSLGLGGPRGSGRGCPPRRADARATWNPFSVVRLPILPCRVRRFA